MAVITYHPQDTLFFRDGRPFNMDESNTHIPSLFPPSPQTLVGAARAVWANQLGWDFKKNRRWTEDIIQVLGDGEDLAGMVFAGPILMKAGKPYYPAPALLVGITRTIKNSSGNPFKQVQHLKRLKPADEGLRCDMGENIRLPVIHESDNVNGRKWLNEWWLNQDGFEAILAGTLPDVNDLCHSTSLWCDEPKIGIEINPNTAATEEAALYATTHVRLQPEVAMALSVNKTPVVCNPAVQISLGGEGRSVWLETNDQELPLPTMPSHMQIQGDILQYSAIVLSPLAFLKSPQPQKSVAGLPGKLISACLPRVQRWGGWDSANHQPLPLKPYLAPGSVLFMETNVKELETLKSLHGSTIGERCQWGFGLIVIGTWN